MKFWEFVGGTQEEYEAVDTKAKLKARRQEAGRLRPREEKRLQEANKLARRRTLRQGITALAVSAAAVAGATTLAEKGGHKVSSPQPAKSAPANTPQVTPQFRLSMHIENPSFWGKRKDAVIRQAAKDWFGKYGCGRSVTVSPYRHQEKLTHADGSVDTTLEVTSPGHMELSNAPNLRNTVLHAMTHACQPNATMLKHPLSFHDGKITGYEGLSLVVKLYDGTKTQFQAFEEAFAEREAAQFPGYYNTNSSYFAAGRHALEAFPVSEYPDAYRWVETNDVPDFVRGELHMSPAQPVTGTEIGDLMQVYDKIFYTR